MKPFAALVVRAGVWETAQHPHLTSKAPRLGQVIQLRHSLFPSSAEDRKTKPTPKKKARNSWCDCATSEARNLSDILPLSFAFSFLSLTRGAEAETVWNTSHTH